MKAIRYTVSVKAIIETVENIGHRWERINATPDSKYDYTPDHEATVQREKEIYEQTVEELDMAALVSVVNGLATK